MSKKLLEVAKECNISSSELVNFLREKGVDVRGVHTLLAADAINKVYDFYGVPKSVMLEREKAREKASHKMLFDENGNPIKKQFDENGKEIPYTGPMFDKDGNRVVLKKKKKVYYDKDGNPIKRQLDENGKLIPLTGIVYDENGRKIKLVSKKSAGEEGKDVEDVKENEAPVKTEKKPQSEKPAKAEKEAAAPKESKKEEKEAPAKAQNEEASGKKLIRKLSSNVYDERRKREKEQRESAPARREGGRPERGERAPFPRRDGAPAGQRGRRDGADMAGAGKDKDDTRRTFTRKVEPRSGGSAIKSELGKELSRNQRANEFKKEKASRNKRDFDDDGLRKPKNKKDPNRKGAFIMPKPVAKKEEDPNEIKTVTVGEVITIKELADKLKKNASEIVKNLFMQGKMYSINSEIPFEEAEEIALGYEVLVEKEQVIDVVEELMKDTEDPEESLKERPPVVCVMGHVDHGKTSILDAIRNTNVTTREAGGITQHIGAYMVEINGRKITFLDTPGHEAFTAMRLRGAMSTDIAVLVVAADDGVMPQTVEAINHAKAAGVQIVVAINKMDKEGANPDKVMSELSEHGLVSEEWGGSTTMVPVSAKKGEGINNLLEMILLTADVMELKSNPDRKARGLVIEAKLDKGRGPVATILVKKGTLRVGDNVVAGSVHGKVRAMINDRGESVKEAGPSTPVAIQGLDGVPGAGDELVATETEKEARTIAEAFIAQSKEQLVKETKAKLSLNGLFDQIQAGNVKELNIIVKADVQGSVEAVKQSLLKLSNEEVAVRIIHSGAGNINESDVVLASASNAIIIGFNVKPDNAAKESAEKEMVDVRLYSVIYNAIDDIEAAMNGMLDPVYEEKVIGHAEIRQIFKASGIGNIAGSYIKDGKVTRNSKVRIFRREELIHEGELASLKRFKDDAKEVAAGYECGLVFDKFSEFEEGDTVEFYVLEEVPRNREKK